MIYSIFKRAMMVLVFAVTMTSATIPARAQLEPAPTSRLLGIALPLSPQRITDPGLLPAYDSRLQTLAAKAKGKMVDTEVLIWGQGVDEIKQQVADAARDAGYTYQEKNKGEYTAVALVKDGTVYGGYWTTTSTSLTLVWGRLQVDSEGAAKTNGDNDVLNRVSSSPIPDPGKKVLAQGNPPLTREMSDAYLDTLAFMAQAVSGQEVNFNAKVKDGFATALAKSYVKLTPAQQNAFSQLPAYLAQVKSAWPTLSEDDKNTLRRQWTAQLKAMIPATPARAAFDKAMARLDYYNTLAGKRALTRSEKLDVAKTLDRCASALRKEGGAQNEQQAAQYEKLAADFRAGAREQVAQNKEPKHSRIGSRRAYLDALNRMEANHNTFMFMMNMNTMNYAATANAISAMGNSGVTYEVH